MGKAKRARERGIQRRTALSAKNIVEYAMSECAKQVSRNRNMQSDALKTKPGLLNTIIYIPRIKQDEQRSCGANICKSGTDSA